MFFTPVYSSERARIYCFVGTECCTAGWYKARCLTFRDLFQYPKKVVRSPKLLRSRDICVYHWECCESHLRRSTTVVQTPIKFHSHTLIPITNLLDFRLHEMLWSDVCYIIEKLLVIDAPLDIRLKITPYRSSEAVSAVFQMKVWQETWLTWGADFCQHNLFYLVSKWNPINQNGVSNPFSSTQSKWQFRKCPFRSSLMTLSHSLWFKKSFYVFLRTISRAIECSQYRECIYNFNLLFIFYITVFIKRHFENAPTQKKAKTKQKKNLLYMIHMGVQVCIILQFWNISQICFALNVASGPTAS